MLRWLVLGAALAILLIGLRRALLGRGPEPGPDGVARGKSKLPKHLVCGTCGTKYDPHGGWSCPKCGK